MNTPLALRLAATAAILFVAHATAAPQSYSIDLNTPPKPVLRGHLDLGGTGPAGTSVVVNSYYIEKNGKPCIPLVGEFHYARYPADAWEDELRKMKSGGLNIVATYVFWNLHERREGQFDWSGNLDLRRFVQAAHKAGLDVIVRVGPFAHGEIRNGGLPDWLYGREFQIRSNDPQYLDYTDKLYAAIGGQVKGLFFKDGGPIIGVQLENEFQHAASPWDIRYVGSPVEWTAAERDVKVTNRGVASSTVENTNAGYGSDHMANLKLIAKKHGLDAPLYTATGWGNAAIVQKGSIPVTSAYAYPAWTTEVTPSPLYLFKDIHAFPDYAPVSYEATLYPSIPAEAGVGMDLNYDRRPFIPEESSEPMMVRMLGSGANGLGYYMYHGGSNPVLDGKNYNEEAYGSSKINYDFQAPLGQYGQTRSHYNSLRLLHLFVESYGEKLAPLASILPATNANIKPDNIDTLRYAARAANGSGFLFLLNFQDHAPTQDLADLRLDIQDGKHAISVPSSGTFTLKDGAAVILPINLDLAGTPLRSATVQPLSVLHYEGKTHHVFFSIDGLAPELVFDSGTVTDAENCQFTKADGATIVSGSTDRSFAFKIDGKPVLVIPRSLALQATPLGDGHLAFAKGMITSDGGKLTLLSVGETSVDLHVYPALAGVPAVTGATVEKTTPLVGSLSSFRLGFMPVDYSVKWRKIATRRYAASFDTDLGSLNELYMRVNFVGDSGMAFIGGEMIDDKLYSARPWEIGLKRFLPRLLKEKKEMVFVIQPMRKGAPYLIDIPAERTPTFAEGQKSYIKVDGVSFTPEYRATLDLSATAPGGFLFATFEGEFTPMGEQIYFGLSADGRNWSALNQSRPVLVSELGEKGVRDPFLLRAHDGKGFYLIATDLSIHRNPDWTRSKQAGSKSIVIWESADLVNWSAPRLVKVAPDDAGCTWAPEAVYDEEAGDYLVFWASTTARDEFGKFRIWAARTKDFRSFGAPFIYIEKPTTIIDTTIVHDGTGYYRFTKDEKLKAVTMEKSPRLDGPWEDVPGFSLAQLTGYEGPACYLIEPAREGRPPVWGLILDHYAKKRGYRPWVTHDLASGVFGEAQGFSFPFKFRHGSVLPLTAEEYARLTRSPISTR
jgi:beta-galactosidase